MNADTNSPDLTLTAYSERAQKSQRFGSGTQALQNLVFGYFGEVGGLLAALKKVNRDKLLVVSSIKTITYQASPRSNLFHRNTTGAALISAMPLRMRVFSSSLDLTRM